MAGHERLTLRTFKIESGETWNSSETSGLLFLFPQSGTGKYVLGSTTQCIAPGEVFVFNAASGDTISPLGSKEMRFCFFSLILEHMFPLLASDEIALLQHLTEEIKRPRWFSPSHPVAIESHKLLSGVASEPTLRQRGQLLSIAASILSSEFGNARTQRLSHAPLESHLLQVFERLSVDELLSLSVEELAAKCNCSRRHINRLFHQHFRFSVGALKMEIRLLKAVSLLRNPAAKVINVAQDCGFNHQGLFNTCFKRRFGVSPGQWRKQAIEKNKGGGTKAVHGCQQLANGMCPLSMSDTKSCGKIVSALVGQVARKSKTIAVNEFDAASE